MASINLLSSPSRVETPYIKVQIGDYTFAVFDKTSKKIQNNQILTKIKYPNYIQSLSIEKINGTVNKYSLNFKYAITESSDPNFFEKVFSSVSKTRKIVFSYGDLSAPTYCYKDEEAIITKVTQRLNAQSAVIDYTVKAISVGTLLSVGAYNFTSKEFVGRHKPSSIIKKILFNKKYGLQEVFYGMSDRGLVELEGLIASDDKIVTLQSKTNISVIDYILYLVDCMVSTSSGSTGIKKGSLYSLVVVDDTSGKFKGPYFKIIRVDRMKEIPSAYDLDIGFPSQNIVTSFEVEDNEGYSIYYDFQNKLNTAEFVQRIDDNGQLVEEYAPVIGSNSTNMLTNEDMRTWWTRVTEYPIKARLTIKGLLRPAILMTHVRLNVYYYGRKHTTSGLYVITKQLDEVSTSGYRTTLNLLRISKATDIDDYR